MKKLTQEQAIDKCKKIHGDKYDYSEFVYINARTKAKIFCNTCKKYFTQNTMIHMVGQGCPICGFKTRNKKLEKGFEYFRAKMSITHNNIYEYDKNSFINIKYPIKIKCKIHGWFIQSINNHLYGKTKCPKCSEELQSSWAKISISPEEFKNRAYMLHGNKYDYSKVKYEKTEGNVCIICPKHGEFWQTPHNHFHGTGCPKCKESFGEKAIRLWLDQNNIQYEQQKRFEWCRNKNPLPYDFYLPKYNTLIEYNGRQHYMTLPVWKHGDKSLRLLKLRDKHKRLSAVKNNMNFIVISYKNYDKINSIMNKIIKRSV